MSENPNEFSIEEYVKNKLPYIAKFIDNELPSSFGFALLAFKFNAKPDSSQLIYVSNADKQDIVKAMKEWIEKNNDKN